MRRTPFAVVVVAVIAASLALATSPAAADTQQFTWLDQAITHTDRTYAQPAQTVETPPDWTAPVDYAGGRVYSRIQILTKPSTKPVDIQICVWRNGTVEETCSSAALRATGTGTFFKDFGTPDAWWKKDGVWRWDTPFTLVRYMVKDPSTGKLLMTGSCGAHCSEPEAVTGHVPIRLDVATVVVAEGATLAPPSDWGGCPTAWAPACGDLTPPPPPDDRPVALITGNASSLPSADQAIRNRLVSRGHAVRPVDDDALSSAAAIGDVQLVVLASSVVPSKIPSWLADLPVPILNGEAYVQTTLRMATSGSEKPSLTTLRISDPSHPLAAGRTGDLAVQTTAALGVGTPVPAAAVVARVPGATTASIYGIERDAPLTSGTAPARRVGFFFSYDSPPKLTAAGWSLFDAAVDWLRAGASAPTTTTTAPTTTTTTEGPTSTTTSSSSSSTTVPPAGGGGGGGGGRAVLLVGDASTLLVGDLPFRNRLDALGFTVELVDDDALSSAGVFGDASLIVVSSSVVPSKIPSWMATVPLPILNAEVYIQFTLRLATSPAEKGNVTTMGIVDSDHPLAGGLAGDVVVQQAMPAGLAYPVRAATVIARVPGADKASLYGIETGATLTTGTAPARRVSFFTSYGSQSRLTAAGWALFDAAVTWLTPNGTGTTTTTTAPTTTTTAPTTTTTTVSASGEWAEPAHDYRLPVTVGAAGTSRTDRPAVVTADFGAALAQAGASGTFGPDTLRVVEVDGGGEVIDGAVPFQFDSNAGDGDTGELVLLLEGTTAAGATRRYDVYFDVAGAPIDPVTVVPLVSTVSGVMDEGQSSIRVVTQAGSWYLHAAGGGFSSLVDRNGMDWIDYSTAAGSAGAYRGIPNVVHPAGHFHPGATSSQTQIVSAGPLRARIVSTTTDGLWQLRYDLYPRFTTMTVLRAASAYWFLYEGTPGGQIDAETDVVLRSSGAQTPLSQEWVGDLSGEEWVAFADTVRDRSLYLAHHQQDAATDSYRLMEGNMTVFGFGRSGLTKSLTGVHGMTVGLLEAETFGTVAPRVQDALRTLTAGVGAVQTSAG